jgi:hypothetical protein
MRIMRVVRNGKPCTCVLDGSELIPVERAEGGIPQTWELAEGNPATWRRHGRLPLGDHPPLPPVEPTAILGAEDNFSSQPGWRKTGLAALRPAALEPFRRPDPAEDVWLIPRDPRSLACPGQPSPLPSGCTKLDAGVTLAAIVGSSGGVAGYCVALDVVRRDVPVEHSYPARSYPGHTVLGPVLCSVDELAHPALVELALDVDQQPRQRNPLSDMIVSAPTLLESIRHRCTLTPGDVVLLGTPPGTALDRGSGWITDGAVIRAAISGIGEIEVTVAAEDR